MNLLFLSTVYPDASQPMRGTYNSALCRAFAESHSVRVIAPRVWREYWPLKLRGQSWQPVVADLEAGLTVDYPCHYYVPKWQPQHYGEWMWRSTRSLVDRIKHEQPIDAVISYWVHPDGDAGLRAAQHCGVPSAVIVGGSDVLILPKTAKRRREIQRVLRETDVVLTVSDGLRQAVIDLDINPAKVHTAYQGMETSAFRPGSKSEARQNLELKPDAEVLVWVGRMVDVKRLDLLIEAFALVAKSRPQAPLCLIGSGPLRAECQERVNEAGLHERVRFVGGVSANVLGDWYRSADLTVLSSDSEGLPNVLRESLACGTPYVTTDVGNIREIDQGRFGRFVLRRDVQGLSAAISAALDETDGPMNVQGYSPRTWKEMADQVMGLIESVRDCSSAARPGKTRAHSATTAKKPRMIAPTPAIQ